MDGAWIGVVGALAGVALTGGLSLVSGSLSRKHDKQERRYEIRRDAYVAFNTVVERAMSSISRFKVEIGEAPADFEFADWSETDLRQALSLVALVGPVEVTAAARMTLDAVNGCRFAGSYADADRVRADFVLAAQRALGLD